MEEVNVINLAVLVAAVSVIFAVLNIILWKMLWKQQAGPRISERDIDPQLIQELDEKLNQELARTARTEDQLWGILDKLKELETAFNKLPEQLSVFKSTESQNAEILQMTGKRIKEIHLIAGKYFNNIEKFNQAVEDVKKNREIINNLQDSILMIKGRLERTE